MDRARIVFALAVLALAAPGCTLLIDGNQYVGHGTGDDAAVDGGLPGDDSAVDAALDGSVDTGPHVNTPPVLQGVGLDDYDPSIGQTVRALPGAVFDADGDATTLHYQWYVDGTSMSGATSAAFVTATLSAGAHLRVEAWANDGMADSPHVSAGDVTVVADTTRWRQLLPSSGDSLPRMAWDEDDQRLVRFVDGGVWEYALVTGGMRIQRLVPTGTPPPDDESAIAMVDPPHHRLLIQTQSDPTGLYALDFSHRGAEVWTRVAVAGTPPTYDQLQQVFYDPGTQRIWVVGGFHDSMGAVFNLKSLDVSSVGAESWTTHTTTGDTLPAIFAAAVVLDPTTPSRVYLFGGVTTPVMPSAFVMRDHALQLDLTASTVTVTESSIALATPTFGAVGALDPVTHHAIVFGGLTAFGSTASPSGISDYDLTTGASTNTPSTDAFIAGLLEPSTSRPGHFTAANLSGDLVGSSLFLAITDVTGTSGTRIAADDRPKGVVDATGRMSSGLIQIVGGTAGSLALQQQWQIDPATWRWTPLTTMDDAVSHSSPPFRFGIASDTTGTTFSAPTIVSFGGMLDVGVLADTVGWELGNDGRWVQHMLTGASTMPTARAGHVVFRSNCGSSAFGFYGGEDALGNTLGDTGSLECPAPRSCTWQLGPVDAGRAYASVASGRQHAYVFGGRRAGTPLDDMTSISVCFSTPMVDSITVTGTPPSPRYGHSAVPVFDASNVLDSFIVFGGEDGTAVFSDTFRFTLSDDTHGAWSEIVPSDAVRPSGRDHHLAFWDDANARMLVVGGGTYIGGSGATSDVWELRIRP